MSVNDSLDSVSLQPHRSHNSSLYLFSCMSSGPIGSTFTALSAAYILLHPLYILVLCYACRHGRRRSSSYSDIITYHAIIMQLIETFGLITFLSGIYTGFPKMIRLGLFSIQVPYMGMAQFHLLTCVERYMAVVHPVTFLWFKQARGVRFRTVTTGCVWLLSIIWLTIICLSRSDVISVLNICVCVVFVAVSCLSSIVVLCTLKRPGVGERRNRVFNTMMAIMGVLLLKFGGNLAAFVMMYLDVFSQICVVVLIGMWSEIPSTIVLPLMFLHRAGKLQRPQQTPNQDER